MDFGELRAALQALLDEPGHITRAAVRALLLRFPVQPDPGAYADADYDPRNYG